MYQVLTHSKTTVVDTVQLAPQLVALHAQASAQVALEVVLPMAGIAYQWHPLKAYDNTVKADWAGQATVAVNQSAPVVAYYDIEGQNRLTVACDCLTQPVVINAGVREEDGTLHLTFSASVTALTIRIDQRQVPYYQAIQAVSRWWEEQVTPYPATEAQRTAYYSTWYSCHQDLSAKMLEAQAVAMQANGITRLILDDGWQTDDNHRGYAYTGDWQVATHKFPDFAGFVRQMHAHGIEVVVWFSVPFVGMRAAKWPAVQDKLLYTWEKEQCGVLDLRYQTNIDYLVTTYRDFVTQYGIDGLKLDFIDSFMMHPQTPAYDPAVMQYRTVAQGLLVLLAAVKRVVQQHSPNFFVEFRQRYIGPVMRQYANALRVSDCPYAAQTNHVGICDLRLLSGETPVHSDMVMWHPDEAPAQVALQLQASLFGVLQLSVDLTRQTATQLAVLAQFLKVARAYMAPLQLGEFAPLHPELNYPVVSGEADGVRVVQMTGGNYPVTLTTDETLIINSSAATRLTLYLKPATRYRVQQWDCCGQTGASQEIAQTPAVISQTVGGYTRIVAVDEGKG
ncbi:glycoside hydrolase family 36 protein [Lacticaseibacillus absianus]|uniref:glycoside hydrolase family 36 protein n=1 Tax=Lacticaseibacillus absianus TaxID=2729623 RepID=UPI0015C96412|nr:glycoside hydrolase family 36 protein [Lacticaseibacillus absianus]